MKADLKQKWIEALRSGKYQQGERALCEPVFGSPGEFRHCCLGVLAEVAGVDRESLVCNEHLDKVGLTHLLGPWTGELSFLKYDTSDPETFTTVQRRLAGMNDTRHSFAQIADWIEANIPAESDSTGAI